MAHPPKLTLPAFLADVAETHNARVALRFAKTAITYEELETRARRLARGLVAAGAVEGTHVALLMSNRPEWVAAAFGVWLSGGVLVPVSTFATATERTWILDHSDASFLLMQRSLLGHAYLDELELAHLPTLRRVFCLGLEEPRDGIETWSQLEALSDGGSDDLLDAQTAEITPSHDAVIVYTSGTTSEPKGVLHRQRAPVLQSHHFAEYARLTPDDRMWTTQPFFWVAGMAVSLGSTLAAGASLVLHETFDAGAALEAIERDRVTVIRAWPHQELAMANHPDATKRDLSSLRKLNFDSPLAPLVGLEQDEWGTQGAYGLSETFTFAANLPADAPAELRHGTGGKPVLGTEIRIVNAEGAELPVGEQGEITVKGPTLMRGYWGVDARTCFDAAGFFHTGDAGFVDDDGYLHWLGRMSRLIKTGGANVSPLEVERALAGYPGIGTPVVVGVPDPTLGEIVVLCAVSDAPDAIDENAIRAFLRDKIARYKVPRHVLAFAKHDVELTGNDKVRVDRIRERAISRIDGLG